MAYSCVKVLFEIGHEASIKNKPTSEGFTHDWEVFVRGADNSDIYHFVDKVVFHLHETFPKPKRVVKEPPYSVKESGYAGFNLPIDIYFKNSDEPKKVRFNYDLHLQTTGPPISKVLREQYVFPNPAEDLRRRLIKGGGVGVGSESGFHLAEKVPPPPADDVPGHKHAAPTLVGKPKLSGSDLSKKHKVKEGKTDETRVSNSFHDLFGPPIKTAKVSPDPKKSSSSSSHSSPKVSPVSKPSKPSDKPSSDKPEKSSKSSKHGSQREGKEPSERSSSSSSSTKEEKKDKERNREKDKNKDKPPKRPSTPVKPPSTPPKRPSSPPKRPPSPPPPPPPKRSSSPSKLLAPPPPAKISTSPKHSSAPKSNKDEPKKSSSEENKSRSESKSSENSKSEKSEKKKKDKKNRDEKPKKDKHKDHDKGSEKVVKNEKSKENKDKDVNKKPEKETIKEPEKSRDKEKEKSKHSEGDKEKQRHKHKKKDKSNKDREKEKEKDKSSKKSSEAKSVEIRDKEKNGLANESGRGSGDTTNDISASLKKQAASSPSPSPVRAAVSPMKPSPTPEKPVSSAPVKEKVKRALDLSDDSSDSNSSALSADEDVEPPVSRIKSVKAPESGLVPVESKASVLPVTEPPRPNSRSEIMKPKSETSSQERNSLNKSSSKQREKSSKKSKERESGSGDTEKSEKDSKKNKRKRSSRVSEDGDCARNNGETPAKIPKLEVEPEDMAMEQEPLQEKAAVEEMEVKDESESEELPPPAPVTHLTEEYVSQLRELQHKIMTLEDNAELQRVVQVIAETGQYEITKKTFDFDLCALDRGTVKRLQEFFTPS